MSKHKKDSLVNFKKTAGLLARIIKMVEGDEYCVDIMRLNLAAIGLLKSAHQKLMESHLNNCFMSAMTTEDQTKKKEMINEILMVTKLLNK